MPPSLDQPALEALRDALARVREAHVPGVTMAQLATALAEVSSALPEGQGLTVDFRAAAVLGQPLIVVRPSSTLPACFETLTAREREVAGLVAVGLRNRDIALALGIRVGTVKDHVHHILVKSGLDGRAAVAVAWTRGGS